MPNPCPGIAGTRDAPTASAPDTASREALRRPRIDSHEVACALLLGGFGAWAFSRLGAGDAAPWVAWGLLALAAMFSPGLGKLGNWVHLRPHTSAVHRPHTNQRQIRKNRRRAFAAGAIRAFA